MIEVIDELKIKEAFNRGVEEARYRKRVKQYLGKEIRNYYKILKQIQYEQEMFDLGITIIK